MAGPAVCICRRGTKVAHRRFFALYPPRSHAGASEPARADAMEAAAGCAAGTRGGHSTNTGLPSSSAVNNMFLAVAAQDQRFSAARVSKRYP